jgi:hypothetical protein
MTYALTQLHWPSILLLLALGFDPRRSESQHELVVSSLETVLAREPVGKEHVIRRGEVFAILPESAVFAER